MGRRGTSPRSDAGSPVARAILQRGLSVSEWGPEASTFLPQMRTARARSDFYRRLHSYAFRLFLRDIIALRDRFRPERLGPFFTPESIEAMADAAERLGIVRRGPGDAIRLLADRVRSFGDTFEWYLAELLRERFRADALWGVKIPGLPCGGDFDVLADVAGRLLYVEAKTSPPKHIEIREMTAFVDRVRTLSPDVAIMVVDTHLRMKDKLVPLLAEALRADGVRRPALERLERETFCWERRLFLTNAKRDVDANLAACLRGYFLGRFFG